jgi:uncharacterized membrane protein YqjE
MIGPFGQDKVPGRQIGTTTRNLLTHLQARTQLLALETREAFRELSGRSLFWAVGGLLLLIGYLLVLTCLIPLLAEWMHTRWQFVGLGVASLHLIAGGIVLWVARRRFSAVLYECTLTELEKDRQWLAKNQTASPGN